MNFVSLIDSLNQNVITIDLNASLLRVEIDGATKEKRLKPYMAHLLYALLNKHPNPLSYDEICEILKRQGLFMSDITRMHRKLSETRHCIVQMHPCLGDFILNTRGVGYSLPLRYKNHHQITPAQDTWVFANERLAKSIQAIEILITHVIELASSLDVIKNSFGYVLKRELVNDHIVEFIAIYNKNETIILDEIRMHEADFMHLRIGYMLSKLKTYVGLARISEYPISQVQWNDWFTQEVWILFEELKRLIRCTQSV